MSDLTKRIIAAGKKDGVYHNDTMYVPIKVVAQLAEIIEEMETALKFECGNRCAYQNPCNARDALAAVEDRIQKMEGE